MASMHALAYGTTSWPARWAPKGAPSATDPQAQSCIWCENLVLSLGSYASPCGCRVCVPAHVPGMPPPLYQPDADPQSLIAAVQDALQHFFERQ
jgi:hypothetical protein